MHNKEWECKLYLTLMFREKKCVCVNNKLMGKTNYDFCWRSFSCLGESLF